MRIVIQTLLSIKNGEKIVTIEIEADQSEIDLLQNYQLKYYLEGLKNLLTPQPVIETPIPKEVKEESPF